MDDVKLLPCPFCGGPAGYYGNAVRYVYCQDRECVGWTVLRADAAAWNRRTPASDGRAEGLREAAEMFHQEQVIVWVQDIVEGLGFADVLKIDSYDDNIAAHEMIEVGLMRIRDAILARAAELEKADE